MFLSLPHCSLDIFGTEKCVNHGGKYKLEFPAKFRFYGSEKFIKLTKKLNKDQRKLKGNCKTLSEVKCIQISDKTCLIWLATERVYYREVKKRFCYESLTVIS